MFSRDREMTVGAWLAFIFLMAIPLVNLIILIMVIFSPDGNKSLKNYILAHFVLLLIGAIFFIFWIVLISGMVASQS